jgi:multidrug efflux pump subunit AcrA (membrane-fusion protein)
MLNKRKTCYILGMALLASAVFSGCKKNSKEEIISSELIGEEAVTAGTSQVELGTFTQTASVSAEKVYGKTAELSFPYDEVELEEVYVKTGDSVKEGDPIAKLKQPTQEDLDNYAASVEEEKNTYQTVLESFTTRIQEKNAEIAAASGAQKEVYQGELESLQVEREQYIYSMEKSLEEMEQEYEKLKSVGEAEYIYAPFDGIVQSACEAEDNTVINSDYVIATIYSSEEILFSFKNDKNFLYGMEVTIEAGVGDNRQSFKGKVVAADNILFEDYQTGKAYVAATEDFNAKNLQNVTISGEVMRLDQVLVTDQLCIVEEQDQYGVSIEMEEGSKYRHISLGAVGDGKAWILQGVEEGQTLDIE